MFDSIKSFASDFFVTGEPMIYASDVAIVLVLAAIVFTLTYLKKWKWLWREWLTTVDHKKIGIMYLVSALLMLFRGGVDALLMRTQLALPDQNLLDPEHYNQIFTTHGTIMILFMAMPFLFAMFNIAVPLQLGARDVAFPFLNAVSFWLFFFGALLFNLSFVIGGSPDAGWTSYAPLTELGFDKGPGENFYLLGVQISGIGSMATGINFLVTILKMRAPGMKLMRLPLFCWSVIASCVVIIFAFPALTIALALLMIDRIAGAHFFTMLHGGNPMMFLNLFWVWGHPEVYIVVLPAYGIYSEIVSTFSKKKIFGYKTMVISLMIISVVSYFVWAHHYFTMGASAGVNSFFAVASMLIGIPTGVKIFNWLFTMFRGRISMKLPMLWTLAFIPCFAMGGATGIMLAMAPADYQYHNSYFLIAHFHQVLIGGVAFGLKSLFGNNVHIFFGEPLQSPCMLLGMMTGLHDQISVQDIGLTNVTEADGLAVGRASKFVGKLMDPILSGCYTVDDDFLFRSLKAMYEQENIFMEPSAHASLFGPIQLLNGGREYLEKHNLLNKMEKCTHLAWSTGGNMVPYEQRKEYLEKEI